MPSGIGKTEAQKRSNVLKNPHLVDWYFGVRLEEFFKAFLDNVLDCKWRWHR